MTNREWIDYREGTNRFVYNRLRKVKLAKSGDGICCTWCPYHRSENRRTSEYGGFESEEKFEVKFPSWKLATRNSKQWEPKPKTYKISRNEWNASYGACWVNIHF